MNNEEELLMLVSNIRSNVAVIAVCACGSTFLLFIGLLLFLIPQT
jgi:hypothetical protein